MSTSKRYLHLGCGTVILPEPFENMDIRNIPGVQHEGDIYPLDQFEDDTFDMVYVAHVLEHFKRSDIQSILTEWVRVLKPGGLLRVSVPSLERLIEIYQSCGDISSVIGPFMGGQTYEQNFHYMLFDEASLTRFMENAGLAAIHPWDFRRTEHSDHWDFSQAETKGIPISLNLEGRKVYPVDQKQQLMKSLQDNIELLGRINSNDWSQTSTEVITILSKMASEVSDV